MSQSAWTTVSATSLRPVTEALKRLALDVERVLRLAGLEEHDLSDPAARLPTSVEFALWDAIVEVSGDPAIGLRVAEHLDPGALGSFGYLLDHSATLEEVVTRAQRYARVVDDLAQVTWFVRDGALIIRPGRVADFPAPPAGVECVFAVAFAAAARTWPSARVLSVHFTHRCGGAPARYTRHFGCPVHFEAEANEFVFAAESLQLIAPQVDARLGAVLEAHTQHLLAQVPRGDDLRDVARRALLAGLARGRSDADWLARSLRLSERTLRRRLSAAGTSFQELLDEVRHSLALSLVHDEQRSPEQVATQLGFGDASSFYRAFKRWTGTTPAQFRAHQKGRLRAVGGE
jgi:AraC-like DNA-binding protein